LFRISLRYGVSQAAIAQRNGITNPARIFAGVTICIPSGGSDSGTSSQALGTTTSDSTTNTEGTTITTQTTATMADSMIVVNTGDNWCNAGEPWGGRCNVAESIALTNYLWRCGWYFAQGLTSNECGAPPAEGDAGAVDETILSATEGSIFTQTQETTTTTTTATTTVTTDSSITFFANTSNCVVDIRYSGSRLPSRWSLTQEFAAAVLSLEDAGCSSFQAYFGEAVVLQGDL